MPDSEELDCHPASSQERIQAYQNVFPVWPHAATLEEHLEKRLASPQHNRAQWFVGCLGERVVVSLGCYPMRFRVHNQQVPGMAIGAVHAVPECRGRGYAPQLFAWVERFQASKGRELSLLFSDITTSYYARLGYVACPSFEGWLEVDQHSAGKTELKLVAFNPLEELRQLQAMYEAHHTALAISIARDENYWCHLIQKWPRAQFCWVNSSGDRVGYVTLHQSELDLRLTDFAVAEELHSSFIAAVLEHAKALGLLRVGGWLPGTSAFAASFPLALREAEITMLKFFDAEKQIDLEMQLAAGRIHEIDHV